MRTILAMEFHPIKAIFYLEILRNLVLNFSNKQGENSKNFIPED
jgi:hypothetical protein